MATDLAALTLIGVATKCFTHILTATDKVSVQTFYSLPIGILAAEEMESDEEEPDLGEDLITLDVYTRDYSTPAGTHQMANLIGERGANAIREAIKENYKYKAGTGYCAALYLTRVGKPERYQIDKTRAIWTFRAEFKMLRG